MLGLWGWLTRDASIAIFGVKILRAWSKRYKRLAAQGQCFWPSGGDETSGGLGRASMCGMLGGIRLLHLFGSVDTLEVQAALGRPAGHCEQPRRTERGWEAWAVGWAV